MRKTFSPAPCHATQTRPLASVVATGLTSLPGLLERYPAGETAVILDPPRVGVPRSALQQLREIRPKQVIYVSCHPATLARDLNLLCADSVFELRSVTPLDMFPQTQHVECVADVRLAAREPKAEAGEPNAEMPPAPDPRHPPLDPS